MLKKLTSVALSALLALSAIAPIGAVAGNATLPAVDVAAPLDGFDSAELSATYTASSPYSKGCFKAPSAGGIDVTLHEDAAIGDYVKLTYTDPDGAIPYGGAVISDSNLNAGYAKDQNNNVITYTSTIRKTSAYDLWWYLVDESGARKDNIMRCWRSSNRLDWSNGSGVENSGYNLKDNVWYTITLVLDFANNKRKLIIDGGDFDNVSVTADLTADFGSGSVTYDGVGVGYLSAPAAGSNFDLADVTLSNSGSIAYDETLTFENGSLNATATAWTSGPWAVGHRTHVTTWSPTATVVGGEHNKAIKISGNSSNTFWFVHTIPAGTVGNNDVLITEGSYYEDDYSQFNIEIQGSKNGDDTKIYPIAFSSGLWKIKCIGDALDDNGKAMEMPKRGGWVSVRVISNLETDTVTLQYWKESDPAGTLITATRANALADFTDLDKVWFKIYSNDTADDEDEDAYQCVDNLRVYVKSGLRYIGSTPMDGSSGNVSLTDAIDIDFNMPLTDASLTGVTVALKDSKGSAVSGTLSLNSSRAGFSFKPSALSLEETYTLSISGTVTDIFGQTLAIDKEITFSTHKLFKLNSCIFSQGGVETESVADVEAGELSADVKITINGGEPQQVAVLLGLYEKESQSFIAGDVAYTDHLTEIEHTLTVTVPDDGYTYYPAVYVWNSLDKPGAYIDSIVLE